MLDTNAEFDTIFLYSHCFVTLFGKVLVFAIAVNLYLWLHSLVSNYRKRTEDLLLEKPFQKERHSKVAHNNVAVQESDRCVSHQSGLKKGSNGTTASGRTAKGQVCAFSLIGKKPETDAIT